MKAWALAYAISITYSVADIEKMHATNRAYCKATDGRSAFESVVANAINRNSMSLAHRVKQNQEIVRLVQTARRPQARLPHPPGSTSLAPVVLPGTPGPRRWAPVV